MDVEPTVIGIAFSICAAMLFFGAVPYYTLRHVGPGKPPPMPRGRVSIAGFGLVDVIGISIFFAFYAALWAKKLTDEPVELGKMENIPELLILQLAFQGFMIVVVGVLIFWRMNLADAFGLRWKQWYWVFCAPVVVIGMWVLASLLEVSGYSQWILDLVGGDAKQDTVKLLAENKDPLTLGIMAVVACIGAPLAEEVVFRGYIYPAMKRFSNISVAVIFTGILFGAVHGNLAALLPLVVLGIILALAYELTGSLWAPIAIHFCFNAATTAIQIIMNLKPELLENLEENVALIGLG
jgi:membrane protease YdiL (CAAX protease family)